MNKRKQKDMTVGIYIKKLNIEFIYLYKIILLFLY